MEYHLNGNEPEIIGKKCCGLCLIQHQEGNSVTDPANTIYFKFDSIWSKLCFDGSTIFWRRESPSDPVNDNIGSCLVLLNLSELNGVNGCLLEEIEYFGDDEKITAKFNFSSGKILEFTHHCYEDFTMINC